MTTEELELKIRKLTELLNQTCDLIRLKIAEFEVEEENKGLVEDLKMGLDNLEGRITMVQTDKFTQFILNHPRGKRGGFGLSRGFGEFLWQGYDWQKEIMDAVRKIERYYSSM